MFCSKCGSNNADGAVYCNSCGAPLNNVANANKKKNRKAIMISVIAGAVFVVIVISAIFWSITMSPYNRAVRAIKKGDIVTACECYNKINSIEKQYVIEKDLVEYAKMQRDLILDDKKQIEEVAEAFEALREGPLRESKDFNQILQSAYTHQLAGKWYTTVDLCPYLVNDGEWRSAHLSATWEPEDGYFPLTLSVQVDDYGTIKGSISDDSIEIGLGVYEDSLFDDTARRVSDGEWLGNSLINGFFYVNNAFLMSILNYVDVDSLDPSPRVNPYDIDTEAIDDFLKELNSEEITYDGKNFLYDGKKLNNMSYEDGKIIISDSNQLKVLKDVKNGSFPIELVREEAYETPSFNIYSEEEMTAYIFGNAAMGICDADRFPDGKYETLEPGASVYCFAHDADGDGKEDLLIGIDTGVMASSVMISYVYDYENKTFTEYDRKSLYSETTRYRSGVEFIDASHNHSKGERIWPYDVYIDGEYIGNVSCWDESWDPEGFPKEADTDGIGTVYIIDCPGYIKPYYSQSEYDQFLIDITQEPVENKEAGDTVPSYKEWFSVYCPRY